MAAIPPIYVIFCKELGDRFQKCRNHLSRLGLNATFFPGIHGKTWGLKGSCISQGHTGLNLSHWWLWQFLGARPEQENEWIILEDDAWLPDDFVEVFQNSRRRLPEDWQIVFLGHYQTGEIVPLPNGELYTGNTTHAYLVRRSALTILIDTNKQTDRAIDQNIAMHSLPKLKYYCSSSSMVRQRSIEGIWRGSL